ncbi:hypothetical protein PTE30175_02401 [Pandoraea terrae]|uniref:Uncharacterized protein n=1 Tax=Pandoraea terrae TaxID=1537710 RepID=A0A5E4V844_9BURK|nr:hypothetical protein [Pandoraea terrae]VVE07734.1 hypothetical protein PTE30175_02401 [Pandoraea terrae]
MGHPSIPGRDDPVTHYVRGHGGTLAHVLEALGKFHTRHGHWPTHLHVYPETLAALVQDLTPLGFYMVQLKVEVVSDLERDLFSADTLGNIAIYRVQAGSIGDVSRDAAQWLGLVCDDTVLSIRPPWS